MQAVAWVIILFSLTHEPFSWFLIPNINNTPAFITISKWLIQSLAIINISGYLVYKFRNPKLCIKDWDVITFHALFLKIVKKLKMMIRNLSKCYYKYCSVLFLLLFCLRLPSGN